jgi:hypothetical protein
MSGRVIIISLLDLIIVFFSLQGEIKTIPATLSSIVI